MPQWLLFQSTQVQFSALTSVSGDLTPLNPDMHAGKISMYIKKKKVTTQFKMLRMGIKLSRENMLNKPKASIEFSSEHQIENHNSTDC